MHTYVTKHFKRALHVRFLSVKQINVLKSQKTEDIRTNEMLIMLRHGCWIAVELRVLTLLQTSGWGRDVQRSRTSSSSRFQPHQYPHMHRHLRATNHDRAEPNSHEGFLVYRWIKAITAKVSPTIKIMYAQEQRASGRVCRSLIVTLTPFAKAPAWRSVSWNEYARSVVARGRTMLAIYVEDRETHIPVRNRSACICVPVCIAQCCTM